MSDIVKQALKLIPRDDLEKFFDEYFQKKLLINLDSGSLDPIKFKNQREQTLTIKNYLLTYRDK